MHHEPGSEREKAVERSLRFQFLGRIQMFPSMGISRTLGGFQLNQNTSNLSIRQFNSLENTSLLINRRCKFIPSARLN